MNNNVPTHFSQMTLRQQAQRLLLAKNIEDIAKSTGLTVDCDVNAISQWVVEWFNAHIANAPQQSQCTYRPAIQLHRHFKHMLNASFSETILSYFNQLISTPRADLHFDRKILTHKEWLYLCKMADEFNLDSTQVESINKTLDSFNPSTMNFELMEAILYILASVKTSINKWMQRIQSLDEEQRKSFLIDVHTLCATSVHKSKRRALLHIFIKLSHDQQKELLSDIPTIKNDSYKLKYHIMEGMAYLPGAEPSRVYVLLKPVVARFIEDPRISFKFLKYIAREKFIEIHALVLRDFQSINSFNNYQSLVLLLGLLPKEELTVISCQAAECKVILDLVLSLPQAAIINHIHAILCTFPINQRKSLLLKTAPYLPSCTTSQQVSELIIAIGLSLDHVTESVSASSDITKKKKVPFSFDRVYDKQIEAGYVCRLEDFVAQVLGDKHNPLTLSAAKQWIHKNSMQVYPDKDLFFRELISNAFDAQLPLEYQIGNFGIGFYSVLSLFYQTDNRIDRLVVDTCYIDNQQQKAYQMIFTLDASSNVQVEWKKSCNSQAGTSITLFPLAGHKFSGIFLGELKNVLDDFLYFRPGYVILNEKSIYGNKHANVSVDITLHGDCIQVKDRGCGIPLSRLPSLLIPGISSKRNSSLDVAHAVHQPIVNSVKTINKTSSVIFTIKTVVIMQFKLDRQFYDSNEQTCSLWIELPKGFKPNLSRDAVLIPGKGSLQAKAICTMILQTIKDLFEDPRKDSSQVLLLYYGLVKWEKQKLNRELQGYFSGYLQAQLHKHLELNPDYIPCFDLSWYKNLTHLLFGQDRFKFIPLPQILVPEGYGRFEMAVVKQYQHKILPTISCDKALLTAAVEGRMIEGLSVCFLPDEWLKNNQDGCVITCGAFKEILLAPINLLNHSYTFAEIQRKICQRFVDEGKRINPLNKSTPSPFFAASIYMPTQSFKMTGSHFQAASVPSLETFHRCLYVYMNSPVIKAIAFESVKNRFWEYYPFLSKHLKQTTLTLDPSDKSYSSFHVLFEDVNNFDAYMKIFSYQFNWRRWFQEVSLVDYANRKVFKLRKNADVEPLCFIMNRKRTFQTQERLSCFHTILRNYPDSFEEVSEEVLFRSLCVLMLVLWGVDPYEPENNLCWIEGVSRPIDLNIFEQGIKSYLFDLKFQDIHHKTLFYSGPDFKTRGLALAKKTASLSLLFSHLHVFFRSAETIELVHNFHDLYLLQEESPECCTYYFGRLFKLYYDYLRIPSSEFSYRYGNVNHLNIEIEHDFFGIEQAVSLLREIPPHLAEKLLGVFVARFSKDLDLRKRSFYLQADMLKIRKITGFNTLGLLSVCYNQKESNLKLINYILNLSQTNEEIAALALMLNYAHALSPAFFELPEEFQSQCMKMILANIIRTHDAALIDEMLEMDYFTFPELSQESLQTLPSAVRAGIECIEMLTKRLLTDYLPALKGNPENIFYSKPMQIFYGKELMEAVFHDASVKEILMKNDLESLKKKLQTAPSTQRFDDFGLINSCTSQETGYARWESAIVELLKNSFDASRVTAQRSEKEVRIDIKHGLVPVNEGKLQWAFQITDSAGFEDLEDLICMLIPGFHPKHTKHFGIGFFRSLFDVSLIYYRTRLQSNSSQVIELVVQPLRDEKGDVVDLKIGLSSSQDTDGVLGTSCTVYMPPQSNVEAYMHMYQAQHFIVDLLKKCYSFGPVDYNVTINGVCYILSEYGGSLRQLMNNSSDSLFGSSGRSTSKRQACLLVDGFPHPTPLNQFLIGHGLLPSSFSSIFKGGFISIPKKCFVSLQDPTQLMLTPESLPIVQKFVLDWLYFHLFNGETQFLEHLASTDGNYDQLIQFDSVNPGLPIAVPAKKIHEPWNGANEGSPGEGDTEEVTRSWVKEGLAGTAGSPMEWISRLVKSHDYYEFFNHYAFTITLPETAAEVRIPSFFEYIKEAYREVYPRWIKDKQKGQKPSFEVFENWKEYQIMRVSNLTENPAANLCNRKLLQLVKFWYLNKFPAFCSLKLLRSEEVQSVQKHSQETLMPAIRHPILFSMVPKWRQVQSFIEEILTFYTMEVLAHHHMKSSVQVLLCAEERFAGQQCNNTLLISVLSHPISQILSLIESISNNVIDSQHIGDLISSSHPVQAGTLNHEIYHAFLYLKGDPQQGHCHQDGVNFEVRAKKFADHARVQGVLTGLENKIRALLEKYSWSAETIKELTKEAFSLENNID